MPEFACDCQLRLIADVQFSMLVPANKGLLYDLVDFWWPPKSLTRCERHANRGLNGSLYAALTVPTGLGYSGHDRHVHAMVK
jgi:hypothetical protein